MLAGLSENDSRPASCVYVVHDEQVFVYIGKTVNGVWRRIRAHLWSHTPLGHAVRVHWPAATWHIEVYNFRTELGIAVVEREPIRRYHPQINWAYNTGRLRIEIAESQLRGPRMGPARRLVIDTGWPSYHDVALESRGESRPAVMAGCSRRPCRGDQDRAFFEACFLDLVISLSQGRG